MCFETKRDPNIEVLRAMVRQIELYAAGKKRYPELVNELDAGIRGLLDSHSEVRDHLRTEWRVLEEVNALALDQGILKPLPEHEEITEKALTRFTEIAQKRCELSV